MSPSHQDIQCGSQHTAQYYTLKLAFLAYLLYPKTDGALKIYDHVLRPALAGGRRGSIADAVTPPTSKPSASTASSPAFTAASIQPEMIKLPEEGSGNITKDDAKGEGFEVISEKL